MWLSREERGSGVDDELLCVSVARATRGTTRVRRAEPRRSVFTATCESQHHPHRSPTDHPLPAVRPSRSRPEPNHQLVPQILTPSSNLSSDPHQMTGNRTWFLCSALYSVFIHVNARFLALCVSNELYCPWTVFCCFDLNVIRDKGPDNELPCRVDLADLFSVNSGFSCFHSLFIHYAFKKDVKAKTVFISY